MKEDATVNFLEENFDDFMKKSRSFLSEESSLLENGSKIEDGVQRAVKDIIEQYESILDGLNSSKNKIIDIFSLGELTTSDERLRSYPPEIRGHHNRKALVILGVTSAAVAAGVMAYVGGPNPQTWSPSLQSIGLWIGIPLGMTTSTAIRVLDSKKFNRENVGKKKLNWMEKLLLKKVQARERYRSKLSLEIADNFLEILNGEYELYEDKYITRPKFLFFGPKRDYKVTALKEEFMQLPARERKQLIKTVQKFRKLNSKKAEIEQRLKKHKEQTARFTQQRQERMQKEQNEKKQAEMEEQRLAQERERARKLMESERSRTEDTPKPTPVPTEPKKVVVVKRVSGTTARKMAEEGKASIVKQNTHPSTKKSTPSTTSTGTRKSTSSARKPANSNSANSGSRR